MAKRIILGCCLFFIVWAAPCRAQITITNFAPPQAAQGSMDAIGSLMQRDVSELCDGLREPDGLILQCLSTDDGCGLVRVLFQ